MVRWKRQQVAVGPARQATRSCDSRARSWFRKVRRVVEQGSRGSRALFDGCGYLLVSRFPELEAPPRPDPTAPAPASA